MRNTYVLICVGIFSLTRLASEEIVIYAPVAQNILIDQRNSVRYSPINLFDDNPATVYAVTYNKISITKPLLEIYFAEPVRFDKLSIKAGYFDDKYFIMNNRVKGLKLKVFNCNNIEYDKSIVLDDKMIEQEIYNGKTIVGSKIVIYVNEIYSGTKWNDLVISDLVFHIDGTKQKASFGKGQCIYGLTFHDYKYDNQGRLIYEYSQYGKSGADEKYYKYENNKIFMAYVGMDDDPSALNYKEVSSIDDKKMKETEYFYSNGVIVSEKYVRNNSFYINQYFYDQNNRLKSIVRICENENWADKYTDFEYNQEGLLIKKTGYDDATIYTNRYN